MKTLTPPQLAKLWAVSPDKILGWIRAGELRAFDVSSKRGGRPAYRIELDAIEEFKRQREPEPGAKRERKKVKRVKRAVAKEYFS